MIISTDDFELQKYVGILQLQMNRQLLLSIQTWHAQRSGEGTLFPQLKSYVRGIQIVLHMKIGVAEEVFAKEKLNLETGRMMKLKEWRDLKNTNEQNKQVTQKLQFLSKVGTRVISNQSAISFFMIE